MASTEDAGSLPHRALLAIIWTCFSVAFSLVALRTAVRARASDRPTPDDYWMFLALAALLSLCILETIQLPSLYYITSVLTGNTPLSQSLMAHTENYLRFQFPITILFWTVLWSVKAGFLALYHKLFRDLRLYRRVWYVLAAFTLLGYGGCIVTISLSCGPDVTNFFRFGRCGKPEYVWASNLSVYYSTAIDVFTDLCIMAMPLRLIYNVKVSRKQKIGLVCVFGLGFVMIAFAIIRAKQVLVQQSFVNLSDLMVWSTLAASVSVVVGTLPALKVLITNRASTSRSQYASAASRGKPQLSKNSDFHSRSVPLGSVAREKKATTGRSIDTNDSQEEILHPDDSKFVLVQHDVTVSYSDVARPYPAHPNHDQHAF